MRLQRRNVNTVSYGTETIASLGAQISNLVPKHLKCSKCSNELKKNILKLTKTEAPSRLHIVYVQNSGFIDL